MTVNRLKFLCLLIFVAGNAFAQVRKDSLAIDTLRNKYLPTGIRAGFDLLAYGKTQFQDNFNGWEVEGDIDFDRYYLVMEYGSWGENIECGLNQISKRWYLLACWRRRQFPDERSRPE